jgi:hypothetical protein
MLLLWAVHLVAVTAATLSVKQPLPLKGRPKLEYAGGQVLQLMALVSICCTHL